MEKSGFDRTSTGVDYNRHAILLYTKVVLFRHLIKCGFLQEEPLHVVGASGARATCVCIGVLIYCELLGLISQMFL